MRKASVYRVYGLRVKSPWPIAGLKSTADRPEVELFDAPTHFFMDGSRKAGSRPSKDDWFQHVRLQDGSDFLRWTGLFECVISADGQRIGSHRLSGCSREAFHAYLLGQVLSFALVKRGIEPLHSTAVVIDGEAVGFVGDCGYGKSTLGAAFLQGGCSLLTDDLLVVTETNDRFLAHPGPPRIKLFPRVARHVLGARTVGTPMNSSTPKLAIPLEGNGLAFHARPFPLRALYVLAPPRASLRNKRITIRSLSPRRAFLAVVRNTFNPLIVDPARLARQFDLAARLALKIPVKSLSFARTFATLPKVRDAIRSDLSA